MYFCNNTDLFFSFSKGRFRVKNWVERKLSYLIFKSVQVIRRVSQPKWWLLPWGPVISLGTVVWMRAAPQRLGHLSTGFPFSTLLWRSGCRTLAGGAYTASPYFQFALSTSCLPWMWILCFLPQPLLFNRKVTSSWSEQLYRTKEFVATSDDSSNAPNTCPGQPELHRETLSQKEKKIGVQCSVCYIFIVWTGQSFLLP